MSPECLQYCPKITVIRETILQDSSYGASANAERMKASIDGLTATVAEVAVSACTGPTVGKRTIEENGYLQRKKRVVREVYVCGMDGSIQSAAFYRQDDKMP